MPETTQYDSLIRSAAIKYHLPWLLIKAQVKAESDFNPQAVSPCGAVGLVQLMPATAADYHISPEDLLDPETNLATGVRYLREQFNHFPEVPDAEERMKFSLAAYNCGRGYINVAMAIAYDAEFQFPMPVNRYLGRHGEWQTWAFSSAFLASPYCQVKGRKPDYRQTLDYIEKIWKKYQEYMGEGHEAMG